MSITFLQLDSKITQTTSSNKLESMIEFNLYVEANNFRELGYKREEGNQRFSLINFLKKDSNYACHNDYW